MEKNTLKKLPLGFQPNQGQASSEVRFFAAGIGHNVYLTDDGIVVSLKNAKEADTDKQQGQHLMLKTAGANKNPEVTGMDEFPGKVNYFIGNDPDNWLTDIPTYAKVKYSDLYPGVDMVCYGGNEKLEYDFIVYPGADPCKIALDFSGEGIAPDENGNLVLTAGGEQITMHKPFVYQEKNGIKEEVEGRFRTDGNRIGFELGGYDAERPLVIDPEMKYSTYLGGTGDDCGYGIAVDSNGYAYVTGETESSNFPTKNPYQPSLSDLMDVFITKLNSTGNVLIYSTYLGGSGNDYGMSIAVDSSGCAYVTGNTASSNFPTKNAYQATRKGSFDLFITKLNAAGNDLVYSTYLGGTGTDNGRGIAVDSVGCAYVAGYTDSTDFPTKNAYQPSIAGSYTSDTFITKLNATGSDLVYSTYLGGTSGDYGFGIAVDSVGYAYVAGYTDSTDFPTKNAYQSSPAGGSDIFITKLNTTGNDLVYSTYLGGTGIDYGYGIAVDSVGCVYVTGYTNSTNFPVENAYQPAFSGGSYDTFITKLNPAGNALVYSTYLGGTGMDSGRGIAVDYVGCAYVTGFTNSTDFPVLNAYQPSLAGDYDVFLTKLNAAGNALSYSTYLGGTDADRGYAIAVDSVGSAYVTGQTNSTDFPVLNAYQPSLVWNYDAIIFKYGQDPPHQATRGFDFKENINADIHSL